jgi:hypothetical protein
MLLGFPDEDELTVQLEAYLNLYLSHLVILYTVCVQGSLQFLKSKISNSVKPKLHDNKTSVSAKQRKHLKQNLNFFCKTKHLVQ